jgi:hypothetical protein
MRGAFLRCLGEGCSSTIHNKCYNAGRPSGRVRPRRQPGFIGRRWSDFSWGRKWNKQARTDRTARLTARYRTRTLVFRGLGCCEKREAAVISLQNPADRPVRFQQARVWSATVPLRRWTRLGPAWGLVPGLKVPLDRTKIAGHATGIRVRLDDKSRLQVTSVTAWRSFGTPT